MKYVLNMLIAVLVCFFATGLVGSEAEAKRLGGGSSFGMQRQTVTPRPAPSRQITPSTPSSPANAPAPRRSWLGPLAGLAAGLGLGALLSHFGVATEFGGVLMVLLLVAGVLVIAKLLQPRTGASPAPMQYAGVEGAGDPGRSEAAPEHGASGGPAPAGFDAEAFLREAKRHFVRLQAANDAKNLDDIREFTTPEVFAEIKMQMDERGDAAQQTDVVTLNAELLDLATEGSRYIASVRFSGLIRESKDGPALPFDEIWHLMKPVDGSRGWVVAGIQQVQVN